MSDATTAVVIAAAFFLTLAGFAVLRLILRNAPPTWRRYRVGVFMERDPEDRDDDEPR